MQKLLSLSLLLLSINSINAQWNSNPSINTPVGLAVNDQIDPRIVTDGKGGAIMTWLDFRNDATQAQGDIFVQRLDKNGTPKWTVNGAGACTLVTDQAAPSATEDTKGGIIVAWNDWRNGNRDIYAQRFDSSGNALWAANGVAAVAKAGQQQDAKLTPDGTGGAIIVWQDSINGAWDIYAQKLNSSGAAVWTAGGVVICSATQAQVNPRLESDGSGGAIITWQDKRNTVDYDIYAQRVNSSGVVQWTVNGVSVASNTGTQSNPKIEPDGSGGAIIAWQDKRNNAHYDIYAQYMSNSGVANWTPNGVLVCGSVGNQSALDMTSEGISGVIITWKDDRNGNMDIYAQKVTLTGSISWATGGVAVATGNASQLNPNINGDGLGGAIITWQDSSGTSWDILAQRLDGSGNALWGAGGVMVGNASGHQESPKNVSDGNGGSIFVFQDDRNTNDYDIYAHHLFANGSSNGVFDFCLTVSSRFYPNPVFQSATFLMEGQEVSGNQLQVLDMRGRLISTKEFSGNHVQMEFLNFDNGTYLYRVLNSAGGVISAGKVIIQNN